jgi:hypothetical protein
MINNPHAELYSAVAGAENCAHRLIDNALEMIRNQGDDELLREIVNKQLLIMNTAMAALLAYRNTLPAIEIEGEVGA